MLLRRILPLPQANPSLTLLALLATASSGFSQTFLLGLFGDPLRGALAYGHDLGPARLQR